MAILTQLQDLLKQQGDAVEAWLREQAEKTPPFFYGSVDLRHAGFKIAPVDTNLFPGGFNNLSRKAGEKAAEAARGYFARHFPHAKRVALVPENHTRNLAYLDNVVALRDILLNAGLEVEVTSVNPELVEATGFTTLSGHMLMQVPLCKEGQGLVSASGFVPDVVVMNNDMTSGIPEVLAGVEIPVIPSVQMGWFRRRKRVHFVAFDAVARDFGEAFALDHWLISPYHRNCGLVDFRAREGFECVATNVEMVLQILRVKYQEYGVAETPYVFVKADSGTYGMGVMAVRSGEEVLAMNKKFRQKMDVIKEGAHNTEVIIQEGVPSIDTVAGASAEPMIYVVDQTAVGGAWRVNSERDAFNSLNAPGMQFAPFCMDEGERASRQPLAGEDTYFNVYGLVARLATLAAAREVY